MAGTTNKNTKIKVRLAEGQQVYWVTGTTTCFSAGQTYQVDENDGEIKRLLKKEILEKVK